MNMADRIQALRKSQSISQEELADRVGVSRQAVSKWESEQSMPDLDKIVALSEIFDVTTDYLLKGIEPAPAKRGEARLGSSVLYIGSTALIFIGLFSGIAAWHQNQTLTDIFGAMCAQALGAAGYFIGKSLSDQKPSFWVKLLNVLGAAFMPCSMLSGMLFGGIAPAYPVDIRQGAVFAALYTAVAGAAVAVLRKRREKG